MSGSLRAELVKTIEDLRQQNTKLRQDITYLKEQVKNAERRNCGRQRIRQWVSK